MAVLPIGIGSAGGTPAGAVESSLRFNSADSAYLNRAPASASNRKTFTWSGWVKRGALSSSASYFLFAAGSFAGSTNTSFRILNDSINIYWGGTGGPQWTATAVLRDPSAWYHLVFAFDTTQATFGNRLKLYVNGVQSTVWSLQESTGLTAQNSDLYINNNQQHNLGASGTPDNYFNGYMTEINFVDSPVLVGSTTNASTTVTLTTGTTANIGIGWNVGGTNIPSGATVSSITNSTQFVISSAATATGSSISIGVAPPVTAFGETDSATGVWKPKAYTGTYGTNGFYLPFKTASQWSGYFDGTGDYLTVADSANLSFGTNPFTVECWFYRTSASTTHGLMSLQQNGTGYAAIRAQLNAAGSFDVYMSTSGTGWANSFTGIGSVSLNTWHHFAIVRESGGAIKIYLNGTQINTTATNANALLDSTTNAIGTVYSGGYIPFIGYISNFRQVVGTAVYTGNFTPPTAQLTAITNTQLLTCQSSTFVDNSANALAVTAVGDSRPQQFSPFTLDFTDDHSGQGNHWQPNNLDLRTTGAGADILVDTPTAYGTDTGVGGEVRGNYCTLNPLDKTAAVTLSNGNLQALLNGINYFAKSTIAISSGKWYWEVTASATAEDMIGITKADVATTGYFGSQATSYGYYKTNGNKYNSATGTAYGASYASGDIIGVALDLDAGTLTYYKNGVSQGTAFTGLSGTFFAGVSTAGTGGTQTINFGQRPFEKWNGSAYVANTAPSGFKALCTQNFTTPTIGATSTTQAGKYFNVSLYNGNGNTGQTITGVGFQPDFTWLKNRNQAGGYYHSLFDAVRGAGYRLKSNAADAEANATAIFSAFTSDGFTFPAGQGNTIENDSVGTYASWNWNAGGSTVTNTTGSISAQVRANTTSGFSIVTYTGTGASATVGHGLGVQPGMVIVKDRSSGTTNDWRVWHRSLTGGNNELRLNTTAFQATDATTFSSAPSSTVINYGNNTAVNGSSRTYVAYCFAPVAGYSAFDSYTANNAVDGVFVYLGFRPEWIMFKRSSTGANSWVILDAARNTYNVTNNALYPNQSYAENATLGAMPVDFLSNGFKIRTDSSEVNGTGTYIYAAFAESPFKYSLAR